MLTGDFPWTEESMGTMGSQRESDIAREFRLYVALNSNKKELSSELQYPTVPGFGLH